MNDEAIPVDPKALERFKDEHDGMEPLEFALSQFPGAMAQVEATFPHLVKKKPIKR